MFDNLKKVKQLGSGNYGSVYLVAKQQKQYALKKVVNNSESSTGDQGYCLMQIDSPHVMKVYDVQETNKHTYILCQYFNGGDLLAYQSQQLDKVFTLEESTHILKDVIKGLQDVHEKGILHRDLKLKNILMKKQGIKKIYALADFGFAKKQTEIGGTTLGTAPYMSPELYLDEMYGYEVDMWAFGVIFYFMLNAEHPFRINPNLYLDKQGEKLKQLALNFSYKKAIQKTKLKIKRNCNQKVQDLFKRIFEVDSFKRIKFSQIREHPLFVKYFPDGKGLSTSCYEESKIIFSSKSTKDFSKFKKPSRIEQIVNRIQKQDKQPEVENNFIGNKPVCNEQLLINQVQQDQIQNSFEKSNKEEVDTMAEYQKDMSLPTFSTFQMLKSVKKLKNVKKIGNQLQKITFLRLLFNCFQSKQIESQKDILLRVSLKYNILRLSLILVNEIDDQITKRHINEIQVKLQCKREKDLLKESFFKVYVECLKFVDYITQTNAYFSDYFEEDVTSRQVEEKFLQSLRISTKQSYEEEKKKSSQLFSLLIIVFFHGFNRIWWHDEQVLTEVFSPFCNKYYDQEEKYINFIKFKIWLQEEASGFEIKKIVRDFLKKFFV